LVFPDAFADRSGTTELERKSGFLCVIWEESTLRRPDVTDPPELRAERRAAGPEDGAEEVEAMPAGGGAEGAGGPPEAGCDTEVKAPEGTDVGAAGPCTNQPGQDRRMKWYTFGFQTTPVVCHCLTYACNASSRALNILIHSRGA